MYNLSWLKVMAKQTGGGILETLQVNWLYVLTGLVGVVVLYWILSRSSFTPKVKEGMGRGMLKVPEVPSKFVKTGFSSLP